MELSAPPDDLDSIYDDIFDDKTVSLIEKVIRRFDTEVDNMMHLRSRVHHDLLENSDKVPKFKDSKCRRDASWKVASLPERAKSLKLIVGDLSASRTARFEGYMATKADAIQVDFDDGHCPSWRNQLVGWHNIFRAARGDLGPIQNLPVMLLRPRAWNMVDHTILVDGKEAPGGLVDFAVIMSHVGKLLFEAGCGPWFFLPKIEAASEIELWNTIFEWMEKELSLPKGAIKAIPQIENILAVFEMDEMLFAMKERALGLNAGIWDYSASIINVFGTRPNFVLPDRNKYVGMDKSFLKKYIDLLIQTCHKRGALATGGMAAKTLPNGYPEQWNAIVEEIINGKRLEIQAGVDGFLFYDINLLKNLRGLWNQAAPGPNQLHILREDVQVTEKELLTIPTGGVTKVGLTSNIAIGILFIQNWIQGEGVFIFNGQVEDSATAEISRSQVWQWIRHGVKLEEDGRTITRELVFRMIDNFLEDVTSDQEDEDKSEFDEQRDIMRDSAGVFKLLVTMREFPQFITTYLNLESTFVMRDIFGS